MCLGVLAADKVNGFVSPDGIDVTLDRTGERGEFPVFYILVESQKRIVVDVGNVFGAQEGVAVAEVSNECGRNSSYI